MASTYRATGTRLRRRAGRPSAAAMLVTALALLSACATGSAPPPAQPAAGTSGAVAEQDTLTGSRIPRQTSDRMMRQTDQKGVQDMDRLRPPNPLEK